MHVEANVETVKRALTLKRRQNGCWTLTRRKSIKKSQSAALKKGTETNAKKAPGRDLITVDDKGLLARNNERIPENTKKVTFWCLNVWND